MNGTVAATLSASTRTTVTVAGGAPTLSEPRSVGSVDFDGLSPIEAYSFDAAQPDTDYTALLESPTTSVTLAVTNKTVNGFDVESTLAFTGTVGVSVVRA